MFESNVSCSDQPINNHHNKVFGETEISHWLKRPIRGFYHTKLVEVPCYYKLIWNGGNNKSVQCLIKKNRVNCTFSPLCISQFQFLPLSIGLSNVPLYLLKLSNLPLTSIFLLNTNRASTNCLKYPILTHLSQPTQSLNPVFNLYLINEITHETHD